MDMDVVDVDGDMDVDRDVDRIIHVMGKCWKCGERNGPG